LPGIDVEFSGFPDRLSHNVRAMKNHASADSSMNETTNPTLKSGLPGTLKEKRRGLRAAMKKHAETLRRLAQ
jgi:hypothetical protein